MLAWSIKRVAYVWDDIKTEREESAFRSSSEAPDMVPEARNTATMHRSSSAMFFMAAESMKQWRKAHGS